MAFNRWLIKACQRKKVDCTPVWLMRQAGRYLKEYRRIREKNSFLKMCKTPEIAAEVTILPVKKLNVDAAILFADILLPLEMMGIKFDIVKDEGVVIRNPVTGIKSIKSLRVDGNPEEELAFVSETIKLVRKELAGKVPLIGFSGAPFTLASYLIEGGHSANYLQTKRLMYQEPEMWHLLMGKLSRVVLKYLEMQVKYGVDVLQIFDSWIGCLNPDDYKKFVMPCTKKVFTGLKKYNIPVIHFATGSAGLLELMKNTGGDVISVDWRINLDFAWKRIGYDVGIQGNLDPAVLFAPRKEIEKRVKNILNRAENRPGHIFNLGHGVLPNTPVENVIALVDYVHNLSKR